MLFLANVGLRIVNVVVAILSGNKDYFNKNPFLTGIEVALLQ